MPDEPMLYCTAGDCDWEIECSGGDAFYPYCPQCGAVTKFDLPESMV